MNDLIHPTKLAARFLILSLCLSSATVIARGLQEGQENRFTLNDMLGVINTSVVDLSDDGRWAAVTFGTLRDRIGINNHRFGDPTYIAPSLVEVRAIDTRTGAAQKVFPDKRQARGFKWSPDASRLALLVLKDETFEPVIWDRATGKLTTVKLPENRHVAENASLDWSTDGAQLFIATRAGGWIKMAKERFDSQTRGPVVVQSSKDPFLSWDDLRRLAQLRSVVAYDIKTGQARELIPEKRLSSYDISEDGSFIRYGEDITKKTDYDVIFGGESQVQILPIGGQPRTLIKSTKGLSLIWSRDSRRYAYAKDGNIFSGSIDDKEPRQLTGKKEEAEKDKMAEAADKPKEDAAKEEARKKERFSAVRLSPSGDRLIASNKEGLWLIDAASGARELFLKIDEEDKQAPRYQVVDWSRDGKNIYLSYASRTKWERGLTRYNVEAKRMDDLIKDSRLYSGFRLSRDGSTFIYSSAEGNRPSDIYAADAEFKSVRRITEANPQLNSRRLAKSELIGYLDADGNKSFGVLYYPADYEPGKKYPTVFIIYEQFFDDTFNGTINVLTSNGYAVMQPSVTFETGFPGEAWVKGVTSAANKLVEMEVADPERLGVQGTSYGGYATNLLITQTNRFKAAINISGKVNMISFYTDSPRLGVRNIHAPEKSQDRIGATLWQQPQKYIQHSAIMFADRIKTPLLLITGEQDHNVPARQAMEMYYALRRLGKEVEWVNYLNGGHGMPTTTVEEVKDYHTRIIKWYDSHLKGDLKKKAEEKKADDPQ
jgi:dipeptidyl aminopeptidase/acylaminoacyl peptidase